VAKICIFEDDEKTRNNLERIAKQRGHEVVGVAKTLDEAISLITEEGLNKATIAIVDGNLVTTKTDGEDGRRIAGLIKRHCSDTTIFAFSREEQDWGHHYFKKSKDGYTPLFDAIDEITK
jgi:DNA-binding response OmpR family regulator